MKGVSTGRIVTMVSCYIKKLNGTWYLCDTIIAASLVTDDSIQSRPARKVLEIVASLLNSPYTVEDASIRPNL